MTTLAEALTAAHNAVTARYGPGNDGITRAAVEAVLALQAGTLAARKGSSGWAGARGDEPDEPDGMITTDGAGAAEAVMALKRRAELVPAILESFKPRKTGGGYTSYANEKTMAEWREQAGER